MLLRLIPILLLSNIVYAQSWDVAKEFSATGNPSGPWSYGWIDGAGNNFTAYPTSDAYDGGAVGWQDHYVNHAGRIVKNTLDHAIENGSSYQVGQVVLHPGAHAEKSAVIRWTAPVAGIVEVSAGFAGLNFESGTTTDARVLLNGTPLFEASIDGFIGNADHPASGESPQASYTHLTRVETGDRIDFAVGHGGNGFRSVQTGASTDSTGLTATLSVVTSELGTVRGNVTASVPEQPPLAKAHVETADGAFSILSAADGSFALMLPPGATTLRMSYPGFPTRESEVTVESGTTTTLDFELATGMISGRVTANQPDSPPIFGAHVRVEEAPFAVQASADGSYALIAPAGTVSVVVASHGYEPLQVEKTLSAGTTLAEDFELDWVGLTPMNAENHERAKKMMARYPKPTLPGVDLAWHMDRTIEYMVNTVDREQGGRPYSINRVYFAPPLLKHDDGDIPHNTARYLLAMMIWEEATGRRVEDEEAVQMLRSRLHASFSGEDHQARFLDSEGGPLSLGEMHSRREVLLALLGLAKMRGDEESADLARRMIPTLAEEERVGNVISPLVSARLIRALIWYHRVTGDPLGLQLAGQFCDEQIPKFSDGQGRVTFSHLHSVTSALSGVVEFGLYTGQSDYVDRAKRVIDEGMPPHRTRYGFVYETDMLIGRGESNNPADLARAEILLGLNGHPEYFEDVERMVRNHLLASQYLDPSVAGGPGAPEAVPEDSATEVYTNAAERMLGGFSYTSPNDLIDDVLHEKLDMAADMASGALEGLAAAWEAIVTQDAAGLRVNLLFSRDTPDLDVHSYIPARGRVELTIKKPRDVYVRIPSYVAPDELIASVNGEALEHKTMFGPYLLIPNRSDSATAVIEFEQTVTIQQETLANTTYTEEWLGDTVWNIVPAGGRVPLYTPARLAAYGVAPEGTTPEETASEAVEVAESNPSEQADSDAFVGLDGERLAWAQSAFASNCAVCHNEDAAGFGQARLNLINGVWNHGEGLEEIEATIRAGIPDTMMKPQADNYEPEQIADLARFVMQLYHETHVETAESELAAATGLTDAVASHLPASPKYEEVARANFIDDYIFDKMKAEDIPHAGISGDAEFMRRVYFDLWGRPPEAEEARAFVTDADPEKRSKLIDKLLSLDFVNKPDTKEFIGPWMVDEAFLSKWRFFYEDQFKNFIHGRREIHDALRDFINQSLKYNVPYDQFVRELITASSLTGRTSGSSGYLIQIRIGSGEGDINHEDTCDEIAVRATRDFLGVNVQCISCHDGKDHLENVNLWLSKQKRVDFWRQAAFFGKTKFQFMKFGKADQPYFIEDKSEADGYQAGASSDLRMPRDENADIFPAYLLTKDRPPEGVAPREEFARLLTSDFQFAKATVNLFWSKFMTVGIVDPPFNWDLARQDPNNPPPAPWTLQPSHPEFLDALAKDFVESGYDLRHLMRTICRSNAYQLSSRFEGEHRPEYDRYYARKLVRRLTAEEIYDALSKTSNVFGHASPDYYPEWTSGWAMDLPSALSGLSICDGELARFLFFFGRGNRNTIEPHTNPSIVQASVMLYSKLVKKKVLASTEGSRTNTLLQEYPPWSWRDRPRLTKLIEELFLTTLSRLPDAQELAGAVKHLEKHRDKGLENLQWALFNKLEFIVNY